MSSAFTPSSSSSNATTLVAGGVKLPDSMIRLNTDTSYGSTGIYIRRFVNVTSNVGTGMTLTQSVANGDSITINAAGVYAITYSQALQNQGQFGISINDAGTSNQVSQLSATNKLAIAHTPNTTGVTRDGCVSVTTRLAVGDVVRAHGDGIAGGGTASGTFTVTQVYKF
jgi:hypothetical protein